MMYLARAWNPEERDYEDVTVTEGGIRRETGGFVPPDWPVEWGFMNTDNKPIYEGDRIGFSWIRGVLIVEHKSTNKMSLPVFTFRNVKSGGSRPAFMDSRVYRFGSTRAPSAKYEPRKKPEPKPKPSVDIYAQIQNKEK